MSIIYSQSTQSVIYSESVSLSGDIVGLSPDCLILEKIESPQPRFDPVYQRLTEQWTIDLDNLQYVQSWIIVSVPRWTDFNVAMLSNTEWQSWKALLPNDLVVALISASVIGKEDAFYSAYNLGKLLAPPSLTQTQNWQSIADQYAIPIVF